MAFETCIVITDSCNAKAKQGPSARMVNNDYSYTSKCWPKTFKIKFDQAIGTNSIDSLGSEFRAISHNHGLIPIISSGAVDNYTLEVEFHQAISFNDTIKIYIRKGNDGNSFLNTCGFEMTERDTLEMIVEGCHLNSTDKTSSKLNIYPNPSSGILTIDGAEAQNIQSIEIANTSGQTIEHIHAEDYSKIFLRHLKKGLYFIKIVFTNGSNESHSILIR